MGTAQEYAQEIQQLYDKVTELEKAIPSSFGYKLQTVIANYSSLFERFCPYQVGDKVKLTKTPVIEKNSGWYGSRHFLIEGAIATITERDYYQGKFTFFLVFDNETWIDSQGVERAVTENNRHVFGFSEDWINPIEH